jgi:hypothetical protein
MKILAVGPTTDEAIPTVWTFKAGTTPNSIVAVYNQSFEFKRYPSLRTTETIKMCYFDIQDPANQSTTIPHIVYYYLTGPPFVRITQYIQDQPESYGLGLSEYGVVSLESVNCFPGPDVVVLVTKTSQSVLFIVLDMNRVSDPERRFRQFSVMGSLNFIGNIASCDTYACYISTFDGNNYIFRTILPMYNLFVTPLTTSNISL